MVALTDRVKQNRLTIEVQEIAADTTAIRFPGLGSGQI